jgi:hypothetical protein
VEFHALCHKPVQQGITTSSTVVEVAITASKKKKKHTLMSRTFTVEMKKIGTVKF